MCIETIIHVACRSYLISIFVDLMARWLRPKNMSSETYSWNTTKCETKSYLSAAYATVLVMLIYEECCAITYKGRDK